MPADLPPNLASNASSAIVRQAENAGKSNPNSQADKNKKDAGRDTLNSNIRRKSEQGSK